MFMPFSVKVKPYPINQVTGTFEVSPIPCHEIVPTLESINFGLGKRCYTFFSKLGKPIRSSRDLKVRWSRFSDEGGGNGLLTTKNGDLMTLEIVFGRKPNMEAFTDDLDASISIHQSNELPLSSQKISKLKPGYNYLITFDKIIEKRMPPPFRTGCDQYKQTMNGNNEQVNTGKLVDERNFMGIVSPHLKPPQSKYDCVDQCLLTLYRQTCNCLPSDINVRRDLLRSNDTFCTNAKCQTLQIHRAEFCATLPRCKPNCEDELYNFEFTITSTLKNIEPHQDQSIITTAELVIFQGQWFQTVNFNLMVFRKLELIMDL
ncbi:uncharacterized protein LOC112539834 [Tetranychus urticae]|uniref:uncharacterized protein LOC112539834 n=1 Tax=Tetranychus urticae TaxID=32264 RepID=UPI000D655463|nr:uncharacterized protein LOC112539834 [Tetranychus urticae]